MKKLQSFIAILLLIVMVVAVDQVSASFTTESEADNTSSDVNQTTDDSYNSDLVDEVIFPHDQVVEVNIEIDEETYDDMITNAMDEEYVLADITYNGYTFNNIAIRPKGNSSLQQVASSGDTRFSFKIDFDKYVDGQNFFGITKLNLNNIFSDDTLMAEYLGYEMLDEIDAVASDTTYISLSINGEYFGLYLAVEEVDETFLMDNFGNYDGTLYKPDMGVGADLVYISDNTEDYSGIAPQDENMLTDDNFIELVTVIDKIVENGGETEEYNLSDILNVDSFLSYLALSTATIHMDTYQSGMYHNYYLYYNTDTEKFEWITWDLNMIFNGFPRSGMTDEEATQFLIDEPVIGDLSQYPLVEAVFTNEEYVSIYHDYLDELINGYLFEDNFEAKVLETYNMIEAYASIDPSAFYTIDQVEESLFDSDSEETYSLLEFVSQRVENISLQLDGSLPTTNNGEGNSGSSGMGGGSDNRGDMQQMPQDMDEIPDELMEMPPDMGTEMPDGNQGMDTSGVIAGEEGQMSGRNRMAGEGGEMPGRNEMAGEEGEMPGRNEMVGEEGEMPGRNEMVGEEGQMSRENQMEVGVTSSTDTINEIITLGVSLAAAGGIVIYLMIRKY